MKKLMLMNMSVTIMYAAQLSRSDCLLGDSEQLVQPEAIGLRTLRVLDELLPGSSKA